MRCGQGTCVESLRRQRLPTCLFFEECDPGQSQSYRPQVEHSVFAGPKCFELAERRLPRASEQLSVVFTPASWNNRFGASVDASSAGLRETELRAVPYCGSLDNLTRLGIDPAATFDDCSSDDVFEHILLPRPGPLEHVTKMTTDVPPD